MSRPRTAQSYTPGDSDLKTSEMLVAKFELNPSIEQTNLGVARAFLTPKGYHLQRNGFYYQPLFRKESGIEDRSPETGKKNGNKSVYFIMISSRTLLTAKTSDVSFEHSK